MFILYAICSKDTRSEIKKIVSEYATKGEAILTKTGQINAKIEVVLEELRKVSLIQKGLKRGDFFCLF